VLYVSQRLAQQGGVSRGNSKLERYLHYHNTARASCTHGRTPDEILGKSNL